MDRVWEAAPAIAVGLALFGAYLFLACRDRRQIKAHHVDQIERDAKKLRRAHQVKDGSHLGPGVLGRLRRIK